ncbi:MAG: glycosyltransferase family 2 protein [Alphaproteobacteria bacterium]|nr:glycosyltransferase family 2 protein [Alphaproteobacteria bacterium]
MPKAFIAVCTAQRPVMLKECILSLGNQSIPAGWDVSILVIENDEVAHCRDIVTEVSYHCLLPIHYVFEPVRGIPYARNHALEYSIEHQSDWVFFIDDDEVASPSWVSNMLEASLHFKADAFQGPVRYEYTHPIPLWFEKKKRRHLSTGTLMHVAATNNIMMHKRLFVSKPEGLGLRFDTSMRFTGGSDTDFFFRATDLGATIRWVDDAEVHETVIAERLDLGWILRRHLRVASNACTVHRKRKGLLKTLRRYGIKSLLRLCYGSLVLVIVVWFIHIPYVRQFLLVHAFTATKHLASAIGYLAGFTPWKPQPYKVVDGY